jgi:hypothetical protein
MGFCARCGNSGAEWHHRRRRAVKEGHDPHCTCIGVWLCNTCHRDVHSRPVASKKNGYIIAPYESEPWLVPILTYAGWVTFDCVGGVAVYDKEGTGP